MIWSYFIIFAIISVVLWAIGAWAAWRNHRLVTFGATGLGLIVFFAYILIMWITLERPPLRTMGETRLWYSFFLPLAGIIVFTRWQYKWILTFSTLLSTVFVCINIFKYYCPLNFCLFSQIWADTFFIVSAHLITFAFATKHK